jgi:hypothetical protein
MSIPVKEVLELRLTPAQVAASLARIQRRTRKIVECGQIDLGDISSGHSDLTTVNRGLARIAKREHE